MQTRLAMALGAMASMVMVAFQVPGTASASPAPPDPNITTQIALDVANGMSQDDVAAKYDLEVVPTSSGIQPMSYPSDFTLGAPTLYYSTSGGYYYLDATWAWVGEHWSDDAGGSYANIGGLDAHGVYFSRQIRNLGGTEVYCSDGDQSSCSTSKVYLANTAYGEAVQFQDKAAYSRTNAGHGSMVFSFNTLNDNCLQFGQEYDHTWQTTNITGIGISTSGFSVSWSTSGHFWSRQSAVAGLHC